MFRNLYAVTLVSFLLFSCSSSSLHKTKSYKNKDEFKSQELNGDDLKASMTLQDKLNAHAEVSKTKLPSEHKKVMIESLQRLKNQQLQTQFPQLGDKMPNFNLKNFTGEEVELYDVLKKKAVVLLFYRGSWCPYCNLELKEYKDYYKSFSDAGLEILAISPELPEYSERFSHKNFFPFPLLHDKKNKIAKKLNLKFTLDPELVPIYKEFGIDIGERNGNGKWEIPVPATLIIAKDRTIKYVFADIDYKKRAEPDSVLAVAKARL